VVAVLSVVVWLARGIRWWLITRLFVSCWLVAQVIETMSFRFAFHLAALPTALDWIAGIAVMAMLANAIYESRWLNGQSS
jgi:hypothetical protein